VHFGERVGEVLVVVRDRIGQIAEAPDLGESFQRIGPAEIVEGGERVHGEF
jgi:hypothetical protein